jgi:hypothetical protein
MGETGRLQRRSKTTCATVAKAWKPIPAAGQRGLDTLPPSHREDIRRGGKPIERPQIWCHKAPGHALLFTDVLSCDRTSETGVGVEHIREAILSGAEPKAFGGFKPRNQQFLVTGYALRAVRRWEREAFESDEVPRFSISISGVGVATTDDVCIIGTDRSSQAFGLQIRSDRDIAKEWETIRRLDEVAYGEQGIGTPERQLRDLQYDVLNKEPPTATLFFNKGWNLECNIPEAVLAQITAGIDTQEVDQVTIGINWECGLVQPYEPFGRLLARSSRNATWGMFTLPGNTEPEPLRGHISVLEWRPSREPWSPKLPQNDNLALACDQWLKTVEQDATSEHKIQISGRINGILRTFSEGIMKLSSQEVSSPDLLKYRLDYGLRFLTRLDEALHPQDGPFSKEGYIWLHRNISQIYQNTTASQRNNFIDSHSLREILFEYSFNPWLNTTYLDWVMLDAIAAGSIISVTDAYLEQRDGVAYTLADGVRWKVSLLKFILRLTAWLIGWGLPAVVCYFIAERSIPAAVVTGAIWYGLNVLGLILRVWSKAFLLFTTGKTAGRRFAHLFDEMGRAYGWLSGPVMHVDSVRRAFDRAAEQGIIWDQQIFYILDRLANQKPQLWSNGHGYM